MRIVSKILIPILLATFFIYLPFIANPNLLLDRHNDLAEFFWPIFYYIKENILIHNQVPLWNNMFFMGTPLFPDPQNPIWYLPNIIFLFLSVDTAILLIFVLHSIFGGIGMYLASREFKLSIYASILTSCLFIVSPKLSGYLEAGHFGLVLSFAWFGWSIYFLKKLFSTPKLKWSIFLSLSLFAIYINHLLTGLISAIYLSLFGLVLFLPKPTKKVLQYLVISAGIFFLIISPILIAQMQWFPYTTRDLLLKYPDVYPKWNSELEFLKQIFIIKSLDTEKIITLGIVPSFLALIGFLTIKNKHKTLIFIVGLILILISLNNLSLIYDFLINQNWYILLRVSTRVWFGATLTLIFLAGKGVDVIFKRNKKIAFALSLLAIVELILGGYQIIIKPISIPKLAPQEVYEFLSHDQDNFRVFCTTRCLSQKISSQYHLKLADGYGTLPQKNYYEAAKQIGQYYSGRYSLSIPPFDVYLYQKLQPYSPTLVEYAIKYVISPHTLKDKNLIEVKRFDSYVVYKNELFKNPHYLIYTPNFIKVDNSQTNDIVYIPETFNKNWMAYDEKNNNLIVSETDAHTIKISTNNSKTIILKYVPYRNIFK
ncbi:hypothetical protein KW795_00390 [Candidatus Microgenomates bacterium]|nr:hypothetical protein [Candidatus Microgenomates bacterium]